MTITTSPAFEVCPEDFHLTTADGRTLRFDPESADEVGFSVELLRLPAETDDLPVDGLACRLRETPFPTPIVFEASDERAAPQPVVSVTPT